MATGITKDSFDLYTRMVFSCLVDADRLDSAGRQPEQSPIKASELLHKLRARIEELQKAGARPVLEARQRVLWNCLEAAESDARLLSLSVPTGGGKTLASAAFALRRIEHRPDQYRRVIVVIPYISIIEQTAAVFEQVFGAGSVLQHHSGAFEELKIDQNRIDRFVPEETDETNYQPEKRFNEAENWDHPFIVTTSVRFFESLFSNRPSDLRRAHNIARSVVILDEAQMLPSRLVCPILAVIGQLTEHWGCTFVLSTATQPAFEEQVTAGRESSTRSRTKPDRSPAGTIKEIVDDPKRLHSQLVRVKIEWRIDEQVAWEKVADWLVSEPQALCVVNTRSSAAKLFALSAPRVERESIYHLSTRMCPAHRLDTIERIRHRLGRRERCVVVSTQLIEAGVDLDFPVVYRALSPLSSIIQAAGRADRHGFATECFGYPAGRVIVFNPEDGKLPPGEYTTGTGLTQAMARTRDVQTDDLAGMIHYFDTLYRNVGLGRELEDLRNNARFRDLAGEFEMIDSRTKPVLVPYGAGAGLINEARRAHRISLDLFRRMQRFTVGLFPNEFAEASRRILYPINPVGSLWAVAEMSYRDDLGLDLSPNCEAIFL